MLYRRLGDAGVKISEIGLGGWLTFGNAVEMDRTRQIVARAFDLGINFIDTADAYARGKCESALGEVLKPYRRADYVLATKVYFPTGEGPNDSGLSRKHIMESLHASLRRLETDYIDLYQCHRYDENTPLDETVRAMDDAIKQGKVVYWGVSEWPVEQIEKCLQFCGDTYYRPKGSQPQYSLLWRSPEERLLPLCQKAGIGQVVWSPLAQGLLTGKYAPGQPLPAESRATDPRQNQFIKKLTDDQALLAKVQKLRAIAMDVGCTMAQLALAWILRRPEISSCIIGATKVAQLEDNAEASGIKLDADVIQRMEETVA
jgi:voltage-dependent potassium channel beta subunit